VLLDTNILLYAARGEYAQLFDFILAQDAAVSVITRIETFRYPGLSAADEEAFGIMFQNLTVFPLVDEIVERAIKLRRMKKMSLGDCIIAATALCHGLPLATRNTADFAWIDGLELRNPIDRM
jgi:predicted nucleic acid-binding protein